MKIDETGKTILRVIVIEDDLDDLDLLLRELRRGGYETQHAHVESRFALEQALDSDSWDLVISDWSLPAFDGLAAFRVTREHEAELPFIIVSGTIAEEHAVAALKAGVNDFITKGRFARLLPAIERELREAEMRRQKTHAEADLERQRQETIRSERLLRSVLQAVPDGVVVVDETGAVKEWSGGADQVLRMPRSDAPLSAWPTHYGLYQADRVTPLRPLSMTRDLEREEIFLRNLGCPKGAWLHVTSRALLSPDGATGAVFVFHDVTKEKAAQEQLMISDRMASVGMLAAGVAHEINNPLGAALLNLESTHEILTRSPEARDEKELAVAMRDARSAVDRVREIVRDLKLFSRHEDSHKDRADLKEALESSLRMAQNEIRHRANVVKQYGDAPLVRGSESRLGQVFLNLLVNAAQAIPEGNTQANTIRVTTSTDARGRALVEICDTGAGIRPDDIPNLFTPFFTTKPPGIGTGLGLPICQRIVAQMGGDIQVESELGKGTTFRVFLPPAPSAADGRSLRVPAVSTVPDSQRRGRVLVVDDEEMLAAAIRRVLSRQHDVVTTTRALDALEKLRAGETFDVIFSDLMMPQITGMELFERISEEFPEQAPRVVFLTGGAFTQAAREFLAKVTNPTLEKPIDRQSLLSLVTERVKSPTASLLAGE